MRWLKLLPAFGAIGFAACVTLYPLCRAHAAEKVNAEPPISPEALAHYLASTVYASTGEPAKAVEHLRSMVDMTPEAASHEIKLLMAYLQNEDLQNALAIAERAIKNDPGNILVQMWLGRIYYGLGRTDDAVKAYTRAIELEPSNVGAYDQLAEIEAESNDLVAALDIYTKLVEVAPDSAYVRYRLGWNLAQTGDNEGGITALEKALELDPALVPARYLLGILYLDTKQWEKSASMFERDLNDRADDVQAMKYLAAARTRLGKYDQAIELLDAIIAKDGDPSHHIDRMYVLLRRGGIQDASIAVAPTGAPLVGGLLQALIRREAGEPYSAVIQNLDTAEGDLDEETSQFINGLMSLFGADDAGTYLESQLRSLVDEGLHSRTLEMVLGRLLMSMQRDADAADVLEKVLVTYGPDKWVHFYLGTAYEELHQRDKVEKHLTAALDIDPGDAEIMNFLGYTYAEENMKLDRAEELLKHALDIDPENGFFLDSLGWIYYRKGDGKRAVEYIDRAIRTMESDDAVLRDHLGDAYLLNGRLEEALANWTRAHRLDPKIKGIEAKIEKYRRRLNEQ